MKFLLAKLKPSFPSPSTSQEQSLPSQKSGPWSLIFEPLTWRDSRFQFLSLQGLEMKEIFHTPLKYYSLHSACQSIADTLKVKYFLLIFFSGPKQSFQCFTLALQMFFVIRVQEQESHFIFTHPLHLPHASSFQNHFPPFFQVFQWTQTGCIKSMFLKQH